MELRSNIGRYLNFSSVDNSYHFAVKLIKKQQSSLAISTVANFVCTNLFWIHAILKASLLLNECYVEAVYGILYSASFIFVPRCWHLIAITCSYLPVNGYWKKDITLHSSPSSIFRIVQVKHEYDCEWIIKLELMILYSYEGTFGSGGTILEQRTGCTIPTNTMLP